MFKRLFRCSAICFLSAAAAPGFASNCGARDSVVERLQNKFSEELAMGGLQEMSETQAVMEIWASDETGTFTVLLTQPNGISCVVAAGTDFFEAQKKPTVANDAAS